jgi:formylglycine-generating enzyme required for sulfatase activity
MHGNVWEWCLDGRRNYAEFGKESLVDPRGPSGTAWRSARGGSWFYYAREARSACRFFYQPSVRFDDLGFRFACKP